MGNKNVTRLAPRELLSCVDQLRADLAGGKRWATYRELAADLGPIVGRPTLTQAHVRTVCEATGVPIGDYISAVRVRVENAAARAKAGDECEAPCDASLLGRLAIAERSVACCEALLGTLQMRLETLELQVRLPGRVQLSLDTVDQV